MQSNERSLKSRILDDDWFIQLVQRRLPEIEIIKDSETKKLETRAVLSAIDYRLKHLHSMKNRTHQVEEIMDLCKKFGFIPQYEVSGPPVFDLKIIGLSPDCTFTFNKNEFSINFILTSNMLSFVRIPADAYIKQISISPSSDKLFIMCSDPNKKENTFFIWSLSDLRILHKDKISAGGELIITWSGDEKKISFIDQTKKITYIELDKSRSSVLIKKYASVSNIFMDINGNELLILNQDAIIIDPKTEEVLATHKLPCDSTWQKSYATFIDGAFNILYNGRVISVAKDSIKLVADHTDKIGGDISDLRSKRSFFWEKSSISSTDEVISISIKYDGGRRTFDVSPSELSTIRSESTNIDATDGVFYYTEHYKMCCKNSDSRMPFIEQPSSGEPLPECEETFFTSTDSIIGFRLVSSSRVNRYVYKRYLFNNKLPDSLYCKQIRPDIMKKFGTIPLENNDKEWVLHDDSEIDVRVAAYRLRDSKEIVLQESDPEDISAFFTDFEWIPSSEYPEEMDVISVDGRTIYIAPDYRIKTRPFLFGDTWLHDPEKSIPIIKLDEESLSIKEIPRGRWVDTINGKKLFFQSKERLFSVDIDSWHVSEIAVIDEEVKYIAYGGGLFVMSCKGKSVYIKKDINSSLEKFDIIKPVDPKMVAIHSGRIISVDGNDASDLFLCSYDISKGVYKKVRFFSLEEWASFGTSTRGNVSLVKRTDENDLIFSLGRVDLLTGAFKVFDGVSKVFEKYVIPFSRVEAFPDLDHVVNMFDYKDSVVIENTSTRLKQKVSLFHISKTGLEQSKNAIVPNRSKLNARVAVLDEDKYIIATVEPDDDKEDKTNKGFRSEIRLMSSSSGKKVRFHNKLDQSEGQMHGKSNHIIGESSKAYSLNGGKYIAFESTEGSTNKKIVNSWDASSGNRFPSDSEGSVSGIILEKRDDDHLVIGSIDADGIVRKSSVYNYKMKKVIESERVLDVPMNSNNMMKYEYFIDSIRIPTISGHTQKFKGSEKHYHEIKDEEVIIVPISQNERREYDKPAPHVFNMRSPMTNSATSRDAWIAKKILLFTLRNGMLCNRVETVAEIMFKESKEVDDFFELRDQMDELIISACGDKYILQQLLRKNKKDVKRECNYRIRILDKNTEQVVEDVIGTDRNYYVNELQMIPVVKISGKNFSYTQIRNERIVHVLINESGKETIFDVCSVGEYHPYALYADENISITADDEKNIIIIKDNEGRSKIHHLNSSLPIKIELLRSESGTRYFSFDDRRLFVIDPEFEKIDAPRRGLEKRTTLKIGTLIEDGGVFTVQKK